MVRPLSELLRPKSEAEWLDRLLGYAMGDPSLKRLPVSDFEPGGDARTFLQLIARGQAEADAQRVSLGNSGFLSTASGEWLDAKVLSDYQLTRKGSVFAEVRLTLTALAGVGPYDLRAGEFHVETAAGLRFTLAESGTVPVGGNVGLVFRAESPGAAYNVTAGTITRQVTPLPGLSVTNAATGSVVTAGADEETDDQLRTRAALRWAERGGGATASAFAYWALTAHPSITKVRVLDQNPRGQGTLDVVVWGDGNPGTFPVQAANDYIQTRRPATTNVSVYAATERQVPVNLTLQGVQSATAAAEVLAGLAALQRQTPIGGTLYRAAIIEVAMLPAGVANVIVNAPAADVVLGNTEALTLLPTIGWAP